MTDTLAQVGDTTPPLTERWSYLPALDGVRAIAVVAVVLFHYWPQVFPGGFVGVDVFFAMSGFLITGILQSEHREFGRIDLGAFWSRRIRRLVPAVIVLVVVSSLAAWVTGTGSARQLLDSVGALTWTTNLIEAFGGGWWARLHNSRTVLDHLWSLAIEEQFYLAWPVLALAMFRKVRSPAPRVVLVIVGVSLSALSMGLVGGSDAYFRTDTRAFELLAGAALAVSGRAVGKRISPWASGVLALSGLVGLGLFVAFVSPGDGWMYPWGFLLVSAASVSLVAAAAGPPTWLAVALQAPPVRRLGQLSYGVYLWHIPVQRVLSADRVGIDGLGLYAVRFAVLAAVVEGSFRFVEEPFRRGRLRMGWAQAGAGYALAAVALVPMTFAARDDLDTWWDVVGTPPKVEASERRVMVAGDLLGAAVGARLAPDDAAVWSIADLGCPASSEVDGDKITVLDDGAPLEVDEFCEHRRRRWARAIDRFDPDVVVIGGGYWDSLELRRSGATLEGAALKSFYRELIGSQVALADPESREVVLVRIDDWAELIDGAQRSRSRAGSRPRGVQRGARRRGGSERGRPGAGGNRVTDLGGHRRPCVRRVVRRTRLSAVWCQTLPVASAIPWSRRVPRQRGALDANRELHDATHGFEVAQLQLGHIVERGLVVGVGERVLVDRHHRLEGAHDLVGLSDGPCPSPRRTSSTPTTG